MLVSRPSGFSLLSVISIVALICNNQDGIRLGAVSAFTSIPFVTPRYHLGSDRSITKTENVPPMKAMLYWEEETEQNSQTGILERLSTNDEKLHKIARLAVAFSPPEHRINLKDIDGIHVASVDGEHIDIVADFCDGQECAAHFIPVPFPKYCGADGMEECILENLDILDKEADVRLRQMEIQDELDKEDDSDLYILTSEFPAWWVFPDYNPSLIEECETLKQLLNENEFQSDMKTLATRALEVMDECNSYTIERAKVSAVGPAGLCFSVRALSRDREGQFIFEVPFAFVGGRTNDASSLREAVLGAVDGCA